MLTKEDNDLLTQVGPGTTMGEFFRQYWLPFMLPWELEADGTPVRVRLLGEDLVAFRGTSGQTGLLADNCPHRGASIFFGRNEEGGLRCVYHGWKFDITGQCVDMPNEPQESNFKNKIRHGAYPTVEYGGVLWAYLGSRSEPPPLPLLEWTQVPESHRYLAMRVQHCNWAQALEGEIDQSHVGFTHSRVADHRPRTLAQEAETDIRSAIARYARQDRHPVFFALDTEGGVLINARRNAEDIGMYYHRLTNFLMPCHTMPPSGIQEDHPCRVYRGWVPIDDENVLVVAAEFNPTRPLTEREIGTRKRGSGAGFVGDENFKSPTTAPFGRWEPKADWSNDFFLDRELQRTRFFSGIAEFWAQDAALQMGMGPIANRANEHLGVADLGIVRVRQRLVDAAKAMRDQGLVPPGVDAPNAYQVRSTLTFLPKETDWLEATETLRRVVPGTNPGGPAVGVPQPGS